VFRIFSGETARVHRPGQRTSKVPQDAPRALRHGSRRSRAEMFDSYCDLLQRQNRLWH